VPKEKRTEVKVLIARKVGMTNLVNDDGSLVAVTLLSAKPCFVTQIKTTETDGYQAIQVGTEDLKNAGKSVQGHAKKAKLNPSKIIREFRINDLPEEINVGTEIKADVFSVGDVVDVTGTSKGKGFAGTIKRHNFKRGRKTHGGRSYRKVGSIGSMYPQRIFKGKRMAGRMGHEQVTVKNLKVALVDPELNVVGVMGAVPGPRQGLVTLRGTE
jgi:large subunit ribosomal protein L3